MGQLVAPKILFGCIYCLTHPVKATLQRLVIYLSILGCDLLLKFLILAEGEKLKGLLRWKK